MGYVDDLRAMGRVCFWTICTGNVQVFSGLYAPRMCILFCGLCALSGATFSVACSVRSCGLVCVCMRCALEYVCAGAHICAMELSCYIYGAHIYTRGG